MKLLAVTLAMAVAIPAVAAEGPHPFNVQDLVMMDRVSDPSLSPDGRQIAFQVRETDYEANKGRTSVWTVPAGGGASKRLTEASLGASGPRWSADGTGLYFLAGKDGVSQLWQVDAEGGAARQITWAPLDVNNFKFSPDGKRVLLSIDVFPDCDTLACTKQRLDERKADKASGTVYDKLFIRHWDTWADGRRSQLFVAEIGADGRVQGEPRRLSRGIDGDVPSKPFGDDGEYAFSPDGTIVYFNARIAGTTEPWSTNFDVYAVPADGLGRTAQPDRRQPGLGRLSAAVAGRQDAVLAGDEAPRLRSRPLRHLGDGPGHRREEGDRPELGPLGLGAEGVGRRQDAVHHHR